MNQFSTEEYSHRRYNPLTGEWIQVSPHRAKRPWQGQVEKVVVSKRAAYDPDCYLCPGNSRANGIENPEYPSTYVFTNDFAALQPDIPDGHMNQDELFIAKSEKGMCKVICFSPRHDLTIPEMELSEIEKVVAIWIKEYQEIGQLDYINYVQIFENKGAVMGCSNPHPHGQIWAQESVPVEPAKKSFHLKAYFEKHGTPLLTDYTDRELEKNERILFKDEYFVGLIPFWAVWPFEAMIVPRRQVTNLTELTAIEKQAFASAYKKLTVMYDNLFEISFPYSAGIHQAPTDGKKYPEWHLHMSFYPPLLRSASVKKFMVGYEMLANPQRDITAEQATKMLTSLSTTHYKKQRV